MAKPTSARDLFERTIPEHKDQYLHRLAGIEARVHFSIEGDGDWVLSLAQDVLEIQEMVPSSSQPADCKIWTKSETMNKILRGEAKILTALLFGKVKVSGDLVLAKKIATHLQGDSG